MEDIWLWGWIGLAVILIPLQFIIAAPYGRHNKNSWGLQINSKVAWVVMELVSLTAFLISFFNGTGTTTTTIVIASLFCLHYIHRSIIYPIMTNTGSKNMPAIIMLFAIFFNVINGYINGEFLGMNPDLYPSSYMATPKFIIGGCIFIIGAYINLRTDYYLISLRKSADQNQYFIPKGKLFRWVSCPNLLGEIIEWTGFAILCWSLPALAFAAWTASNLIPRAWHHHRWYKEKFTDYPKERKALIPRIL